mmetsp:Transcript_19992/g.27683  ORF Transcript_19992/g.27683 Transcript_19992/m.27683 type:complete len:104 (-) Transcript_19992:206-517(-)
MDTALAEATANSSVKDPKTPEDYDKLVAEALACPCVTDIKEGACGQPFVESFSCFIRSQAEEKGSDCINVFQGLQECMANNAEALSAIFPLERPSEGDPPVQT